MNLERQILTATVVFVNIPDLRNWSSETAYAAMVGLHNAIASHFGRRINTKVQVFSTLTGAIIVMPDASNLYAHDHLTDLGRRWVSFGIPVRVGVVHGEVEVLRDVDDLLNIVGSPVNTAARIAVLRDESAGILHKTYIAFSQSCTNITAFLQGSRAVTLRGKSHDREPIRGVQLVRRIFPTIAKVRIDRLPRLASPTKSVNGVAIGYDLPRFSAGDHSEISKRFRGIRAVFDALKAEGQVGSSSRLLFAPGGDGGILVLPTAKRSGFQSAERLARLLQIESTDRRTETTVLSRIGLHYGAVNLYRNAAGVLRPTGRTCLIADSIASDRPADGRIVLSEVFRDIAGEGNREIFEQEYEELPPLRKGPAADIQRYTRRSMNKSGDDPWLKKLLALRASWEPAD